MSIFINRVKELEFLERKHASKEAEMIVIYGRRRIGKTELMLRLCEGKEALYFIGRLESKEDIIKRFNNLIIGFFNDNHLLNSPLQNWDSILDYIAEKADKRLIIVLDEFPFIVDRCPEIVSVLQDKWDSKLKNSKIMIILSGSSVGMMEKYALDYKSPLYGRRTGQWKVDKMEISHLKEFFPHYHIEDLIMIYGCLDTIPGYLSKFSSEKSLDENVAERMLSKGEFLYEEVEILLREELRDPSNYMSILSSIAGGTTTFNEINNRTSLDKSLLSKYLSILESLGIVEREIPVTETYKSKLKAKGALYFLKDNFFDFWFRFIYLNKQEIEKGYAYDVLKNIKKDVSGYMGRKFEKFSMEIVSIIGNFNKIGQWWNKNEEIDIVALNEEKKEILFGECKWSNKINALEVVNELSKKARYVEWVGEKRKESFVVFAKSFSKKIEEFEGKKVYCLDLKDIENALLGKGSSVKLKS